MNFKLRIFFAAFLVAIVLLGLNIDPTMPKVEADTIFVSPTGSNDDLNIQAAIDNLPANGGTVILYEGTFNLDSVHNIGSSIGAIGITRNNVKVVMQPATKLVFRSNVIGCIFVIFGTTGTITTTTTASSNGSHSLLVNSSTGFAAGDDISIYSSDYRFQITKVTSVAAGVINIEAPVEVDEAFPVNTTVTKMTYAKNITIEGGELDGNSLSTHLINVVRGADITVRNVVGHDTKDGSGARGFLTSEFSLRNRVSYSRFYNIDTQGIEFYATSYDSSVDHTVVESAGSRGFSLQGAHIKASDNRAINSGDEDFRVEGDGYDVSVIGNTAIGGPIGFRSAPATGFNSVLYANNITKNNTKGYSYENGGKISSVNNQAYNSATGFYYEATAIVLSTNDMAFSNTIGFENNGSVYSSFDNIGAFNNTTYGFYTHNSASMNLDNFIANSNGTALKIENGSMVYLGQYKISNSTVADITGTPSSTTDQGARVYRDSNQSIPSGAYTAIVFNQIKYDTDGLWSSNNPTRLTANLAGKYQISGSATIDGNPLGAYRIWRIKLNGTIVPAIDMFPTFTGASVSKTISFTYPLSAGDYIEFEVYQDSGTGLNIISFDNTSPGFSIQRIG